MAELKTKQSDSSVEAFLQGIDDPRRLQDCRTVLAMMKKASKSDAKMWGTSIIGFGSYHYKYESGHEGDMCVIGFSPRKAALAIYLLRGLEEHRELLARLGKHTTGKGCLYIKRLEDVDLGVLDTMFTMAAAGMKKISPTKPPGN
jgi:Domain of unknown function (DU1801)